MNTRFYTLSRTPGTKFSVPRTSLYLDIRVFRSRAQAVADLPYFTQNSIGKSNISWRQIWKPWAKVLHVHKNCEYNKSTENQNFMLIGPRPASPGFPWVKIVSIFLFNISKLVHFGFTLFVLIWKRLYLNFNSIYSFSRKKDAVMLV